MLGLRPGEASEFWPHSLARHVLRGPRYVQEVDHEININY